ncbi:MAG: carboxypeptidase-like regulatory domain-containing protein [Xanthobacteraceae bacterium]
MSMLGRRTGLIAGLALMLTCCLSTVPWAGGSGFDDEHDPDHPDGGPPFFGFVKDTRGGVVAGAKVTVGVKSGAVVVTQSNILGAYRIPGFQKDIDTKTVEVVCEKDGYKYVRSFRRTISEASSNTPIETECILQKV